MQARSFGAKWTPPRNLVQRWRRFLCMRWVGCIRRARHHTLPKIGLPLIMCPDICSFQCTCTRPPKLEVAKGPRCGINVHFPTGRIVTTPRDGGHSLPTRPCRPDFHIFHFFRVFCVLPRFFTLFSVPSLFPSVLCRVAFLTTHFFPLLRVATYTFPHLPQEV